MEKPLSPQLTGLVAPGISGRSVIELGGAEVRLLLLFEPVTFGAEITAKDIAWCAQVDRARRERWASAGRLKRDPPYTEHDAVETAIAFSLAHRRVSQKAAVVAWDAIQREVQRLLIGGERDIWVVVSAEGPRAWAFAGAEAAARRADGEGRCWIVATGEVADEARLRYSQLPARATSAQTGITRLRRSGRGIRAT